jgi:hypothetical protein
VQQQQGAVPIESPRTAALDGVRAAVAALKASHAAAAPAAAGKRPASLAVTPLMDAFLTGNTTTLATAAAAAAAAAAAGGGGGGGAAAGLQSLCVLRDSIDVAAEAANIHSCASSPMSVTCLPLPPLQFSSTTDN